MRTDETRRENYVLLSSHAATDDFGLPAPTRKFEFVHVMLWTGVPRVANVFTRFSMPLDPFTLQIFIASSSPPTPHTSIFQFLRVPDTRRQ